MRWIEAIAIDERAGDLRRGTHLQEDQRLDIQDIQRFQIQRQKPAEARILRARQTIFESG